GGDSMCYFVSGSKIGKRILRACPIGSECHVVATVKNDAAGGDWSPIIIALIEVNRIHFETALIAAAIAGVSLPVLGQTNNNNQALNDCVRAADQKYKDTWEAICTKLGKKGYCFEFTG